MECGNVCGVWVKRKCWWNKWKSSKWTTAHYCCPAVLMEKEWNDQCGKRKQWEIPDEQLKCNFLFKHFFFASCSSFWFGCSFSIIMNCITENTLMLFLLWFSRLLFSFHCHLMPLKFHAEEKQQWLKAMCIHQSGSICRDRKKTNLEFCDCEFFFRWR